MEIVLNKSNACLRIVSHRFTTFPFSSLLRRKIDVYTISNLTPPAKICCSFPIVLLTQFDFVPPLLQLCCSKCCAFTLLLFPTSSAVFPVIVSYFVCFYNFWSDFVRCGNLASSAASVPVFQSLFGYVCWPSSNTEACKGKSAKSLKMNQRRAGNARPSGTDGSDFSYRMVVDSRYKKVTQFRSRLSVLIFTQALIQLIGLGLLLLSKTNEKGSDNIAVSSFVVCFISLLIGELGRKRSKVNLLKVFVFGSSLSLLISIAKALSSTYVLQVIKDFSSWNTSKFEFVKVTAVIIGLVAQIFVIRTTMALIHNMAPPKRTS